MSRLTTIEIRCRFEGTLLGTIGVNEFLWTQKNQGKDINNLQSHGIGDARCDTCVINHGHYKRMKHDFLRAGGTEEQFEVHMKKNIYKNTAIKDAILNLQEGKNPDAKR